MATKDERRGYADKKFDSLALSIGRLTLAWNSLHLELFVIFASISGYSNRLIPGSIWHAINSDRAQREILKDLTKLEALGFDLSKEIRREINWVIDKTNNLENIRNDFIHTTFAISEDKAFTLHLGQHKRGLSFEGRDIQAEADWLFGRTSILSDYSTQITNAIRRPNEPLPERPLLPNRPRPNGK